MFYQLYFIVICCIFIKINGKLSENKSYFEFYRVFKGINVHETRLMNMLFGKRSHYNSLITPVANSSQPLHVYFGLALTQIINVYEKEQIVKVNVWLQLRWYDYQMRWNPDRFGLFKTIRKRENS